MRYLLDVEARQDLISAFLLTGPSDIGSPSYTVLFEPPLDFRDEQSAFLVRLYELISDIEAGVMDYYGAHPNGYDQPGSSCWAAGEATEESWPVILGLFQKLFAEQGYQGVLGHWSESDDD